MAPMDGGKAVKVDTRSLIARAEAASTLLAAMANPKRLMILCELLDGECSVNELSARLDVRQTTVSQHLSLLRKDGFVASRRSGQTQFYSLVGGEARAVLDALHGLYCAQPANEGRGSRGKRAAR
jgi:DNA-binding transcriptional ArsR family regulator